VSGPARPHPPDPAVAAFGWGGCLSFCFCTLAHSQTCQVKP
jgi:hypothetical protein